MRDGAAAEIRFSGLTPKQRQFTRARSRYVAYGGARGGGKTHVLRWKAAAGALAYPGIRILVVRREYPELEQTVILPMRKMIPPEAAAYNGAMHMMSFVNGSVIKFGHYRAGDELEYQGQEYDWIFLDEATQFTERQFRVLGACLRGAARIPRRMYLTCNPGGVGHLWVKRLFVSRDYRGGERAADYTFIQATVYDNPYLLESSPEYVQQLELLPEGLRAAWLNGDWDAMSGAFFPEVRRDTHEAPDFRRVPAAWRKYRAFDYGLDMFACLWIAEDFEGRSYVYREVNRPGLIVSQAARLALELTPPDERIDATIAPPDMWSRQKDSGRSMAEIFMENGLGIIRAGSGRVQGWMALKEALKPMGGPGDRPGLLLCESCPQILRDLQAIQHDEERPEDCAVTPHDVTHGPDALRYYAVTRRMAPEPPAAQAAPWPEERRAEDYDEAMTGGDADGSYLLR